jgi:hypothetical protein
LRRELLELEDKYRRDEIKTDDYFAELDYLRKRLRDEQALEVQTPYEPGVQERERFFDVQKSLEGIGTEVPYIYASEYEKQGVDPEEALERGKQKLAAKTRRTRYGTGEFVETMPTTFQVSDIVDPVKGLIKDPETGQVRKATDMEMIYSALFERQRKPTDLTTAEAQEKFKRQRRGASVALAAERQPYSSYGYTPKATEEERKKIEETLPKVEERMDVRQAPESPAVIAESSVDYGFRLLNTLSGVAEPLIFKPAQEVFRNNPIVKAISYFATGETEAPKAKVRKGAGYKETEIEGMGGQILTNMLTGQGVFNVVQAQLLPPDDKASGLEYFMTAGTLPSYYYSFAPEIYIPATPAGIPGVMKAVKAPQNLIKRMGARAEQDLALRSVQTGQTSKSIAAEIKANGGKAHRPTVRNKVAEVIGDQYATVKEAEDIIGGTRPKGTVKREEFSNPTNPVVDEIFKYTDEVPVERVKSVVGNMNKTFDDLATGGKTEREVLRRSKQVADDTLERIREGRKPKRDADIIDRAIARTIMEDTKVWESLGNIPTELETPFNTALDLLKKQKAGAELSPDEIISLGRNYDLLNEAGIFELSQIARQSDHVYTAVRNAVADVMKDNFLKNIPDDYIYVGQNVAVPYKNVVNPRTGKTAAMQKVETQVRSYFETVSPNVLHPRAAQKILRLQSRTGLKLPAELQQKVQKIANGATEKLAYEELQFLQDSVLEEFALDVLGGVRLKTGSLTGQMAGIPEGATRQTLIPSGQAPSSFAIEAKGIANALRLMITKGGEYNQLSKIADFLKLSDDVPVPVRQLNTAAVRTHNAAPDKVVEALKPPAGTDPVVHFNNTWKGYQEQGMALDMQRINGQVRTGPEFDVSPTRRESFIDAGDDLERSKRIATSNKLMQLSDKYGRDNITEFLSQELGVKAADIGYDDLIAQVDFIEANMQVAAKEIYSARTWKNMVADFFVAPSGVKPLTPRWADNIYDVIRIDKTKPYWSGNNIKPLTLETYKEVITELRRLDPSLQNYGLRTGYKGDEVYTLPFVKQMVQTQRAMDMQVAIDDFITKSPDIFVDLERTADSALSLSNVEKISDQMTEELRITLSMANQKGLIDDDKIELMTHIIRERLFDGMAKDIWTNSSREVKKSFIQRYLDKVSKEGTPFIYDMDDWVVELYRNGHLTSQTFNKIEKDFQDIFQKMSKKFDKKGLTDEEAKIFEMVKDDLFAQGGLLASMRSQYLNNLTLRSDGVMDGLFTQQIQSLNDYFGRFGVNNDVMVDNVRRLKPRIEYLGAKNVAVIYGDTHQKMMNQMLEIIDNKKTKQFIAELEQKFANLGYSRFAIENPFKFLQYYFTDGARFFRRWSIARMLGGGLLPSLRFFGMNRMTAPYLYFASLGSGSMRAGTATRFVGQAMTMGLDPAVATLAQKMGFKSYTGFLDSNRVLFAPADEVLIRQADGAIRDMTAGELRKAMLDEGVEFSRADADFLDTQFNRLLIDSGMTVDGFARYYNHPVGLARKIFDHLDPSGKNIWAEFAKMQDTEMRRFVFMDAIKNGESIQQAAEKARRSMLDYGSLSQAEKKYISSWLYFYSFMRTMGAETINAFYRSVLGDTINPAVGLMKAQARLNRDTEDRVMSAQQKSRIFNIFTTSTEGQDYYVSGPVNPSIAMFDLMSRASLTIAHGFSNKTPEEKEWEQTFHDLMGTAFATQAQGAAQTYATGNPFLNIVFEGMRARFEKRPIPFPSELIYDAEQNGNMLELIKLYGLVPREPTPGRPLTRFPVRSETGEIIYPAGTYFDFPRTDEGLASYNLYLWHRMVGLTAFGEVTSRSSGLDFTNIFSYGPAAQSRYEKETRRAEMFSYRDPRIQTPEGEERLPTESVYLKSLNQQDLDARVDLMYTLYMIGLFTPTKATKRSVIMERLLRNAQNEIKSTEKSLKNKR